MHIPKADYGALGFGSGCFHPGCPIGLEHQSHGPRGYLIDEFIEKFFRGESLLGGLPFFEMAEFLLEPVDHPVSAKYLDFDGMVTGDGRRIWRNQRYGFDIFFMGNVDRGGCAVAQTTDIGPETSGANNLTGFVCSCRYQGQP